MLVLDHDARRRWGKSQELQWRKALRASLEPVAIPRYWRVVDEIPVNSMNKRVYAQLQELFHEAHEIERRQPQADRVEIVLSLDPALFWFRGHFAVQPLLPGVAQIDWAMHYATRLLAPAGAFMTFRT